MHGLHRKTALLVGMALIGAATSLFFLAVGGWWLGRGVASWYFSKTPAAVSCEQGVERE